MERIGGETEREKFYESDVFRENWSTSPRSLTTLIPEMRDCLSFHLLPKKKLSLMTWNCSPRIHKGKVYKM